MADLPENARVFEAKLLSGGIVSNNQMGAHAVLSMFRQERLLMELVEQGKSQPSMFGSTPPEAKPKAPVKPKPKAKRRTPRKKA